MSKKKNSSKKLLRVVGQVSFLTVVLILVSYVVAVLIDSSSFMDGFSERTAYLEFESSVAYADNLASDHYDNIEAIVERLQYAETREEVISIMSEYEGDPRFGDLRYYSQHKSYMINGVAVDEELAGNEPIASLANSKIQGCTEIYFDPMVKLDCIAFFMPVRGSAYVDGVLSIVPARNIIDLNELLENNTTLKENTSTIAVIDASGRVFANVDSEDFTETVGNNFFTFITNLTDDSGEGNRIKNAVLQNERMACSIDTSEGGYTIVIAPMSTLGDGMVLVTLSESSEFIVPELLYIRHVINISVIALIALVIGVAYVVYYHKKSKTALATATFTDPTLGCPNAEQFKRLASGLLHNRQRKYAISIFEIRQFSFMSERLSEADMTDLLQFVAKLIETFCSEGETYGYLGDGRFALLIVYANDRTIRDRVRLLETLVNKNDVFSAVKMKRKFNIGISLAQDGRRQTVQELLGYAGIACEKAKNDINVPYVIFNDETNNERLHNAVIESEMEAALANNEFRLFLQPKYNVAEDKIDSAEALVRWFDTKKGDYRFPGEFIGLFESNGFIVKLDHYMYIETMKYLSNAAERGEKLIPISVNVSIVTVNTLNFLDFYIENKKKYRVPDGCITIEFTESFAMGDYQKIREILDTFHKNGINCSLDDFGTGYSSLGVLKNLPFDELKFDRMFLTKGYNKSHDDTMIETLFSLARSLNMRVVQEGVETKEMYDSIVSKGCDVIQGYYYAKAIPVEEYRLFINSNTSIKYKSRVK